MLGVAAGRVRSERTLPRRTLQAWAEGAGEDPGSGADCRRESGAKEERRRGARADESGEDVSGAAMRDFYRSTVGKKIIMAVTGLIGVGFVILHVAGNLQAFSGREKINAYSALLHGPGAELLWIMRIVLLVAVALHVVMAVQLTRRARAARPVGYHNREP